MRAVGGEKGFMCDSKSHVERESGLYVLCNVQPSCCVEKRVWRRLLIVEATRKNTVYVVQPLKNKYFEVYRENSRGVNKDGFRYILKIYFKDRVVDEFT